MATFTDSAGRDWDVRLTVGTLTRVREVSGVELGKVLRSEDELTAFLFSDPESLGRVLWTVCESQAESRGVTPEAFAGSIDGDAIRRAVGAVLQSVADFFPLSRTAQAIRANVERVLSQADATAAARMATSTSSESATNSADSPG